MTAFPIDVKQVFLTNLSYNTCIPYEVENSNLCGLCTKILRKHPEMFSKEERDIVLGWLLANLDGYIGYYFFLIKHRMMVKESKENIEWATRIGMENNWNCPSEISMMLLDVANYLNNPELVAYVLEHGSHEGSLKEDRFEV